MKDKQTAVDFAIEQLEKLIPNGNQMAIFAIKEQAKQMEKEQIRSAYVSGFDDGEYLKTYLDLEYYNETYENHGNKG
jgi:hypothetical protein